MRFNDLCSRLLKEVKYSTASSIKKYVEKTWLPEASKIIGMPLRVRNDKKYLAIMLTGRKTKNIFAFIDKRTGEVMRPKSNNIPHTIYQPNDTESNINDPDGGLRYAKNVRFHFLP